MGWTSCPPSLCGWQDARPTRYKIIYFVEVPNAPPQPRNFKIGEADFASVDQGLQPLVQHKLTSQTITNLDRQQITS
ncbi:MULTISPECIES: hypothetical protein [unclassified Tolypothrix]|uniref:hypothetical protein n=1 Tax=unclassified Tolypothrix TaxID=2649714 RepID=UPI0005EAB07A|nr:MULTISPECIES: hypothetical protein [unclassified Tolypothrix]EKF03894.1 hypothetical protein FDUTEX481_03088 [Tolypothrix sp. PCC 7601]MBE9088131.1 hypothetical protein [Tolypothrix sp. LEGE 11397]UYD36192.1 hypothetical protein HG267_10870 [Tolypothrix sp. PCC 7601]BAY94191.1 hypothetical protein NIES3275_62360 [Microchaete diplosiphon NIES-3275]